MTDARFFALVGVATIVIASVHCYFWLRLVRSPRLPRRAARAAAAVVALLGASLPANFLLMPVLTPGRTTFVQFPIYVWMGAMLLLLSGLVAVEPVRIAAWAAARLARSEREPAIRQLVARVAAAVVVLAVVVATAVGSATALGPVTVRDVRVELDGLPPALAGTTIVQISDLHLGPTLGRRWLERVAARVNALEPDVVAITGDLVDGPVSQMRDIVAPIARLDARRGVFFVTGNHEYYWGAQSWVEHLPTLGVRVLRNERVVVGDGDGDASFELAGIDDARALGMAPGHGADLARALEGRDPTRPLVLLAHQPRAVLEASRAGVDLQLSGHTHGGQLWPWMYLVRLQQPALAGLDRFSGTWLYTSVGTGFWGPPIRLGTTPEIARVVLGARRP
jgi:predicted MPP superfamily phosphohydrolase